MTEEERRKEMVEMALKDVEYFGEECIPFILLSRSEGSYSMIKHNSDPITALELSVVGMLRVIDTIIEEECIVVSEVLIDLINHIMESLEERRSKFEEQRHS